VIARDDFYRDLHERGAKSLKQAVESSSAFEQVYRDGDVAVYRLNGRETHASLGSGL
jgi:hypothetical protein